MLKFMLGEQGLEKDMKRHYKKRYKFSSEDQKRITLQGHDTQNDLLRKGKFRTLVN